jgi:glycosyltransferase involved in cell wall biosynthesis
MRNLRAQRKRRALRRLPPSFPPTPVTGPEGKRRIVMLVNRLRRGGGAERTLVTLAIHLPRDRFDVTVVTTRPSAGPLLDTLAEHGIRHLALDRRARLDLVPFRRLVTLLRRERIDVLHSHMFGSNLWGALLGRLAGVPVVVAHEHSWSYEGQPLRRFLDGHVIGRLVDAFVAVSDRDRERMVAVEAIPAEKVVVLRNPYVPRPRDSSLDVRVTLGLPRTGPLICTVAVLRPEKSLEVLVRGFAQLLTTFPDASLVIAGDGECRPQIEREIEALGISSRVRLPGWWHDVGNLLDAADVAVMTSEREGLPLFALECAAHRTPLISTDVGDLAALLGDGAGVTLVPRGDPSALAGEMRGLLDDPVRRERQVSVAAMRLGECELGNVIRDLVELYDRLSAVSPRYAARSAPGYSIPCARGNKLSGTSTI